MTKSPEKEPYWTGPGYRGEYTCPCGVGHGNHVHGCCGLHCCSREDYPLRFAPEKEDDGTQMFGEPGIAPTQELPE